MRTKAVKSYNGLPITRLKILRAKTGMSQREFAKVAGLNASGYSELENNRKTAHLQTLMKIADILKCDIDEILYLLDDKAGERGAKGQAARQATLARRKAEKAAAPVAPTNTDRILAAVAAGKDPGLIYAAGTSKRS